MVDTTLRWVIRHEKRTVIVITLTFVTGILLILPAVEDYSAAKERIQTARENLEEAQRQVENLPQLQRLFERQKRDLSQLEAMAVTAKEAENLRELLQKAIRETGCIPRTVDVRDQSQQRPWMTNDSPIPRKTFLKPGDATPFQLVTRTATLQLEGPMTSVYQFMSRASQLQHFIYVKSVRLERTMRDPNLMQLDMEIDMFDLARGKPS